MDALVADRGGALLATATLLAGGPAAGSPGYDAADLCTDIERLSFLLCGNDGEHLLA